MASQHRRLNFCLQGPSTQYSGTLVSRTIKSMVLGTRNLKYWALGPSGLDAALMLGVAQTYFFSVCRLIPYPYALRYQTLRV